MSYNSSYDVILKMPRLQLQKIAKMNMTDVHWNGQTITELAFSALHCKCAGVESWYRRTVLGSLTLFQKSELLQICDEYGVVVAFGAKYVWLFCIRSLWIHYLQLNEAWKLLIRCSKSVFKVEIPRTMFCYAILPDGKSKTIMTWNIDFNFNFAEKLNDIFNEK